MLELGCHEGRIAVLTEPSQMNALQQAFRTHLAQSSEIFQWLPLPAQAEGDCLVFQPAGDRASDPDAYAIEPVAGSQGNRLTVTATNGWGLLAGAWDVLERLEVTEDGMRFHGTTTVERPAFPHRIFWTWDHSANWSESPGQIDWGCNNAYCKPPEAFFHDYRALIDYAPRARVNGVTIVGFLRDDHGGVPAARQVLDYGRSRHVRVLPGFCAGGYNGLYYQGEHEFNEECRLRQVPEQAAIGYDGQPLNRLCQSHPENIAWRRDAVRWLTSTFDIDAAEIEFSDYAACQCPRCREERARMGGVDADYLKELRLGYGPMLEQLLADRPNGLFLYATFTGFNLERKMGMAKEPPVKVAGAQPDFLAHLPEQAVCLWTITEMLHDPQVPLARWLDDGKAAAFYEGDRWPHGLRAPARRNMGLLHQGSYWFSRNGCHTRYSVEISSIKEACLRGEEAGLEGFVFIGETADRCIPCELNYQAFAHFTYHPQDSLREFAIRRLSPLLGGEDAAQLFIEALAEMEHGPATAERYRQVDEMGIHWREQVSGRILRRGEPGVRPLLPKQLPAGHTRLHAVRIWRRWEWLRLRALRGPAPTDADYLPFP